MKSAGHLSKRALYVLLAIQAILAFVLGIFGNKVAELINTSPKLILVITIILMVASLLVTIGVSRHENRIERRNQLALFPTPSLSERFSSILLNRIVTIFPLGVVMGVLVSSLSITALSRIKHWNGIDFFELWFIHSYEIISFIAALISLMFVSRRRRDILLVLSYALGFAASVTGVFLVLRPEENSFYLTFLGWSIVLALIGLTIRSRTFDVLYNDLIALIKNLVRDRTS